MADDGASRRPPQAYAMVSPAGVGTTTTNQVSSGTLQEILDTGDRSLIDQAFDQVLSHPQTLMVECPQPGWEVKLLELLQLERSLHYQ